ncbi:MAG: hypothetical protein GC181_15120 [Bacteroidetes bacterium]|nr:hypothetical protein [Bacteroidota bacterium]
MNKITTMAICAVAIAGFTLSGCSKKGEDDPFISLRSRDSRLKGEYDLTGVSIKTDTKNTSGTTTTESTTESSYSGGVETTTKTNVKTPTTRKYNMSLMIDKDGTITLTWEDFNTKGESNGVKTIQGNWVWESTAKHKSGITLAIPGDPSGLGLTNTWNVQELKNKEVIFTRDSYSKNVTTNSTGESTGNTTLTFTSK